MRYAKSRTAEWQVGPHHCPELRIIIRFALDDLGYRSFSKECGEVLFNLLSNRSQKGSMVITTNLTFDRWVEVFKDEVLTGAIVDRIGRRAHVVDMTGESHRVIETERWPRESWKEESAA